MSSRPRKKQRDASPIYASYYYDSGEASAAATSVAAGSSNAPEFDDDDDEMDLADLRMEGGSIDAQIGAILEGSSDTEIVEILAQLPALNDGMKLVVGMQKLSAASSAFELLQPVLDACSNEGLVHLYNKISGLSAAQLDADIPRVFEDDPSTASALMTHPPELRRRRFFLSLAAGYLDMDNETWAAMNSNMDRLASSV